MGQVLKLKYEFEKPTVYGIQKLNSSFDQGSLRVLYTGQNRNGSYISKDSVIRALPSLFNVPIVCHYNYENGTIGGHDIEVVREADGSIRIRNLTEPCGVVPESASFSFETYEDENGVEHEYLIIDGVLLWKRQDVYKHIIDDLDGKVKHSMEISVGNGFKDESTNLYHIEDFEFTALCLLEDYEPCFQGSELELFSVENFRSKMEEMMTEFKNTLNQVDTSKEDSDKHPQTFSTEGGEEVLNEKMDLAAEYGIDVSTLDFSIEELSIEELRTKFDAIRAEAEKNNGNAPEEKFALVSVVIEEIIRVLDEIKVEREWGEYHRYCYVDCDFEENEVYCWDTNDWLLYGFKYTVNGDSISIDYDSKKRKKYVIADFDEGEQKSPFAEIFAVMEEQIGNACSNVSELTEKYQEASNKVLSMDNELNELRTFKTSVETERARAERDVILARFSDLNGNEAFEALKDNLMEYDTETLEEKCYAIRGRAGVPANFNLENKTVKIKVDKADVSNEPYGGIFAKYGIEA